MNHRRVLGRTQLKVNEIGFGTWAIGGNHSGWGYGATDDRTSIRALQTASDLGCNFFDTADWYGHGHSEKLLGKALRKQREEMILATKGGFDFYHGSARPNFNPDYLRFALHQSLRRLGTDYIDIYQLHNPAPEIIQDPEVISELERFRSRGVVRWLGVSAASVADACTAVEAGWADTVQVPFNLLASEAEFTVFPMAAELGVGIIAREPLANGFLTGKYGAASRFPAGDFRSQAHFDSLRTGIENAISSIRLYCADGETLAQLALRFVLERQAVSVVICGCKTPAQVRENFSARRALSVQLSK